jgi:hypothetical protein
MKYDLERILKEAQNSLFNILFPNMPGGTKEKKEKTQSGHKLHFLTTNMSIIWLTYMLILSALKFTVAEGTFFYIVLGSIIHTDQN